MNTATGALRLLVAVSLFLAATTAQAVWPFNEGDASKAEKLAGEANAQLQAADEVWRAGNMAKAAESYQAAAATYRQAEQLSPDMQNGLIKFRISYCVSQVEQIQNAREKEKAPPAPPVTVTHPAGLRRGGDSAGMANSRGEASEPVDLRRELAIAQRVVTSEHPEDALPSLITVLRAEPTNRLALLLMATLRVQQGRYDDAIVTIEGLRESDEDEAVLLLAAGAYCGAGRYFDALLSLDKAMKKNPESPQANIDMAYLLLEMSPEKRADATAYYKHARKLGIPRDALLEKRLGLPASP